MSLETIDQQSLPARPLAVSLESNPGRPTWVGASRFGYAIIILFFGGLGGWAGLAPLASGVTVAGTILADSGIKTVQHLEGGLVDEVLVRDGQLVSKGDVLLRLDPLRTAAKSVIEQSKMVGFQAEWARLSAQADDEDVMTLDNDLLQALEDPVLGKLVEREMNLFEEQQETRGKQMEIRRERIAQIHTERSAQEIRLKTTQDALALIDEELATVQELVDKRLTTKSRLLSVKRARTGLFGQEGTIRVAIARTNQRIHEQELLIEAGIQSDRTNNLARMKRLDVEIHRLSERMTILEDQKRRIDIRAPARGRVLGLVANSVEQVVGPAQVLMYIVPENEAMILDAKVKSKDIEQVRIGAMVKVRLTAFNPRLTPPVDGQVISVTPTTLKTAKGRPKYGVTVKLDSESLKRAIGDQKLTSGMPASGMIAVGEQTLLSYLLTPMTASFEMALREP
jgi:HlyD family type I secretion membrane fusion protein